MEKAEEEEEEGASGFNQELIGLREMSQKSRSPRAISIYSALL